MAARHSGSWTCNSCLLRSIGFPRGGREVMRKENYAGHVMQNMPQRIVYGRTISSYLLIFGKYRVIMPFDIPSHVAYLYLHTSFEIDHGQAKANTARSKGGRPRPGWRAQPAPRGRSRCAVHRQSVFRPQGPCSGSLRNGAP